MWCKRVSAIITLAVGVVLLSAAACGFSTGPSEELALARSRWQRLGPPSYTYTIGLSCECTSEMAGPATVLVRNGIVESRSYVRTGATVPSEYTGTFTSVEGLFAMIDKAVRDGREPLVVRYDPILGYPTRIEFGDPAVDAPVFMISGFSPR
jgi:hypothetical protein